ncbi:Glycocyamine kinase, partial [Diplonema papillatum]
MSSATRRSKLWYVFFAGCGGSVAYLRHGRHTKDARFSDYPDFTGHHTVVAKKLTHSMYNHMKHMKTPSGFTLDECIQAGVDLKGSALGRKDAGLVAGDVECYDSFRDIFEDVINELHPSRKEHRRSLSECGGVPARFDPKQVPELKLTVYRNLDDFPFPPAMSRAQRRLTETTLQKAFSLLPAPLAGRYKSLKEIKASEYESLNAQGCMLAKPASEADRISGLVRDWPDARGLFVSAAKDLFVWVNGRHHVQVISRETGGDLGQALQRLVAATESIENSFGGVTRYLWDPSHGYLGHDLSEIGNAIAL